MLRESVKMHRMRLARGVVVCLAAAVLASVPAASALADATAGDTTAAETSTTATGTTATTATGTTAPAAGTTAPATGTTAPAAGASTSAPPTTAGATTGSTPSTAASAIPVPQSLNEGCVFGGVALVLPNRTPLLIGPVADAPSSPVAAMNSLVYPADGSVVSASAISLEGTGCTAGKPAGGTTEVRSLSLFGGTITAQAVGLTIADAGARHADTISGLEVNGAAVQTAPGTRVPLGSWGYLETGSLERFRTPEASGTQQPLRVQASALAVHLVKRYGILPPGTVLLISFAGLPGPAAPPAAPPPEAAKPVKVATLAPKAKAAHAKPAPAKQGNKEHSKKKQTGLHHAPFRITPPLGLSHYVFPVTGTSSFGDTYGAFRGDVPGNWHHGDDIFAPLGTPVVAVADGTVNRVGWQKIGGWRIWVVDTRGNWFYYAHLSGYSPAVIRSKTVKAGEVIGFVGNSGDAFTTPPHLHFEIHPSGLRHWGYDGAVDPTSYLDGWTHLQHVHAPRPAHPRLPRTAAARHEARYVFRELLAARGLLDKKKAPAAVTRGPVLPSAHIVSAPHPATPAPRRVAMSPVATRQTPQVTAADLAAGGSLLVLLALSGSAFALRRTRGRAAFADAVVSEQPAAAVETPAAVVELPAAVVMALARVVAGPAPLVTAPPPAAAVSAPTPAPVTPRETLPPERAVADVDGPSAPRRRPVSLTTGTGSVALVALSVVALRRRAARARRRTTP